MAPAGELLRGEWESLMVALDFEYDNGYGGQNFFGVIWYEDGAWSSAENTMVLNGGNIMPRRIYRKNLNPKIKAPFGAFSYAAVGLAEIVPVLR